MSNLIKHMWLRSWFRFGLGAYFMLGSTIGAQTWDSLLTAANAANSAGNHASAMDLGYEALKVARSLHGDGDSSVALVYHRLGVYNHAAPFDSAIFYYDKAMAIWKILDPPHPLDEAKTLNNLGQAYMSRGLFQKASDCIMRSLELKESVLGENDNSLARAYHVVADLNFELGNYVAAEQYAMRALQMRQTILPDDHPDIASTENLLGNIAQKRSQWERAEYWYKRAITRGSKRHGKAPPGFASNLAVVWLEAHKYAQAESLYTALLADTTVKDRISGFARALAWNNIGLAHQLHGLDSLAVPEFDSGLAITMSLFGPEHLEYARLLRNKGRSLTRLHEYGEAEPLLLEAQAVRDRLLPEYHVDRCNGLRGLGWLYWAKGDNGKAFDYFHREFDIYRVVVNRFIPYMTQYDALRFSNELQTAAARCLSVLSSRKDINPGWKDSVCAAIIYATKGVVSRELANRQFSRARRGEGKNSELLDELSSIRSDMFALLTDSPDWSAEDSELLDSLEFRSQQLEQQIVTYMRDYDRPRTGSIGVSDIACQLPDKSVLAEYFLYAAADSLAETFKSRYVVVLVHPDSTYKVVDLGYSGRADSLIDNFRKHFYNIDSVGVLPGKAELARYDTISSGLYDYFVAPLEQYFGDPERVFVALDGRAHLISLNCLKDRTGRYLIERWPIHYLGCGRELVEESEARQSGKGLLAIGDPDFDFGVRSRGAKAINSGDSKADMYMAVRGAKASRGRSSLQPLPGTRHEIELIASSWRSITNEPAELLLQDSATEQAFRSEVSGKRVVYIATHGFFQDDSLATRLPFLHCGLYLAGANRETDSISLVPSSDGILTAQDILLMDFQGVDLVVLSACESGLGEVTDGEGVFGLRRAFHIAGARSVVSSLWRIPDAFTARMMASLFEDSSADLMTRIRDLEVGQLNRLRREGLPDHPYAWAAFISSGDWR